MALTWKEMLEDEYPPCQLPSKAELKANKQDAECREKHGGDHPWVMEFEGGTLHVSCGAEGCPWTYDDVYPDWGEIAYLPPIPVAVVIQTSAYGGYEYPVEYDVDIAIDLDRERLDA